MQATLSSQTGSVGHYHLNDRAYLPSYHLPESRVSDSHAPHKCLYVELANQKPLTREDAFLHAHQFKILFSIGTFKILNYLCRQITSVIVENVSTV